MANYSKNVLCYGEDKPLAHPKLFRIGALSFGFDSDAADLRFIRFGEHEILRRLYAAVRDFNWETMPLRVSNLEFDITATTFRISFQVEHRANEIDFAWQGTIKGTEKQLIFSFDGVARSAFRRNRIGFCVLHPDAFAGLPCTVETVDGSNISGQFPFYISPFQPFKNIRAITHQVSSNISAEVRMEGDTFEMEDQRNWSDASYKTYCTPIALPFPVQLREGDTVSQKITVTLSGQPPTTVAESQPPTFTVSESTIARVPRLGLVTASHGKALTTTEVERLKALSLAHLRADVDLSSPETEATLVRATEQARALNVPLELALHVSERADDELAAFRNLLDQVKPSVAAWFIFHHSEKVTTTKWVSMARKYLSSYDPSARLGAGTDAFFTELNRSHPPIDVLDVVTYSVNPQVHAFENRDLVETLPVNATVVRSAQQFCGDVPLSIGPITLKMRFNPNATGPQAPPAAWNLPTQVDPRQMSLFGAGWTVGALKYHAESNVHALTFYETTGWRGTMEMNSGSPLPEKFCSVPGAAFPLYHVLADFGEMTGGQVLASHSSAPMAVDGFATVKDGRLRIVLRI